MFWLRISCLTLALFLMGGCQSWQYRDIESLPPTAALPQESQQGVVHAFYWKNVSGYKVEDLTTLDAYPNNPTETIELNSLSGPGGIGDNYGTLVRGYIEAPQSGDYRFFVSGDDQTQFWLSQSQSSAEATLRASVTGWTYRNQFDKYSSQASPVLPLAAGQKYYFEIKHKEATGGDHFTVAWEGPGINREVISSEHLHSLGAEKDLGVEEAYSLGYRVGFLDGSEGLAFNTEFPPLDQDADGLYDNWEVVHGLDPSNPDDATTDPDSDLLSAADEFLLGTSENNSDTDRDGIPDGVEFAFGLDPLDPADANEDLDGDGFSNLEEYQKGSNLANVDDKPENEPEYVAGYTGQYFIGMEFNQFVTARIDTSIDFNWRNEPISALPGDRFSARWFGIFSPPHSSGLKDYEFTATTDDGVRLYIDGELVINDWSNHGPLSFSHIYTAEANTDVNIVMEYYENTGGALARLIIEDLEENRILTTDQTIRTYSVTSAHTVDSDVDGIPDTWELQYGLNPSVSDSTSIFNTSGVTNLEAYESGLNPWTLEPLPNGESSADAPETGVAGSEPVTLSWTAPSTRMDGTSIALSEIDYYVISYGQDPQNLSETQRVDGAETSFEFDGLSSGTWYFTIRVVDIDGQSSPESELVSAMVD